MTGEQRTFRERGSGPRLRSPRAGQGRARGALCRAAIGIVPAVLLLLLFSCTRYVPKEPGEIEIRDKVLITFENGDKLRGRLALDEWVDVTVDGVVYRGRIVDLTDEEIMVGDAVPVKTIGEPRYERARLADARVHPSSNASSHVLRRDEIREVRLMSMDGPKTARRVGFWNWFGLGLLLLILEHSA